MTSAVTLAVLLAALCHASWNAIVRTGSDKLVSITLVVAASGLLALPALFFVPIPAVAAWPYLVASATIHVGYNSFLALSYHHGELSRVYPLVRGSAPLLTLIISVSVLDEDIEASAAAGIVVLAVGIMMLALDGGWRALIRSPRGLVYAAATSLCITAYTLSDGLGARAAGNAHAYVIWLFAIDGPPMLALALALRGRQIAAAARIHWRGGLMGGALSLAAYWIVIWAFTVAPIPIVAALRETSILFAALIGSLLLKERVTAARAGSIACVLCGLALMRLS